MSETTDSAKMVHSMKLITALRAGDLEAAMDVLKMPLNPNLVDPRGSTPLAIAAYRGYATVCAKLLDLGADVLYEYEAPTDDEPRGILDRARMSRDAKTIEVIERAFVQAEWTKLQAVASTDHAGFLYFGSARLLQAARLGMLETVVHMVSAGIPIDSPNDPDQAAIVQAADSGHFSLCAILGVLGADLAALSYNESISPSLFNAIAEVRRCCQRSEA